jgi:hypothetical protein
MSREPSPRLASNLELELKGYADEIDPNFDWAWRRR